MIELVNNKKNIDLLKSGGKINLDSPALRGKDGGYYKPAVSDGILSWVGSKSDMPAIGDTVNLKYNPTDEELQEIAQKVIDSGEVGVNFKTDKTLTLNDGILSVNTADDVEKDNTLPITSSAVYTTVGNIEILLQTI